MDTLRINIFIILLGILPSCLTAQLSITSEHYTTKNGLSSDLVLDIQKDNYGFLWIATANGLNRFDGYHFKHYLPGSTHFDFPIDFIRKIKIDKDGNFWLCGDGLVHMDITANKYIEYSNNPELNQYLFDIEIGNEDYIWLRGIDNGIARFNYSNNSLQIFKHIAGNTNSLSNNQIRKIFKDKKGNIWIGTIHGLNLFLPQSKTFRRFYLNNLNVFTNQTQVNFIAQLSDTTLLLQLGNKLYIFDTEVKEFSLFKGKHFTKGYFLQQKIELLNLSDEGKIIFFNESQDIVFYDIHKESYKTYRMDNYEFGIYNKCFYLDHNDIMWIGDNSGMYKIDTKQQEFNWIYHKNMHKLFNITDIHIDKNNRLYAGVSKKLYQIEFGSEKNISKNQVLYLKNEGNLYSCFTDNAGYLWVGGTFLHRYLPKKNEEKIFKPIKDGIAGYVVWDLLEDKNGNIWIGTGNGISYLSNLEKTKDKPKFVNFPHVPEKNKGIFGKRIQKIFEDSQGNIWIATDKGLTKYSNDGTYTVFGHENEINKLPQSDVISIQEDKNGNIWAGVQGAGLCKIVPKSSDLYEIKNYTVFDGLPNNSVAGILEDAQGDLWLSTYSGLSRLDPETEKFTNFWESDGLRSVTFNTGVYAKDTSGILYFGSNDGLLYFNPESIRPIKTETNVLISDINIRNKTILPGDTVFGDIVLNKTISATKNIEISFKNNDFSLEFTVDNFSKPQKVTYKYQLDGYDKIWKISTADDRKAVYTNLPQGNYIFKVKATGYNGEWSQNTTQLNIKIYPPWWKTWWALVIYTIILISLSFMFRKMILAPEKYRNQLSMERLKFENELKMERVKSESRKTILEKEKELTTSRIQFFMNISHEFRTPLTLIRGLTEDLFQKSEIQEKLKHQLGIIHRNSVRLTQLVNQLLDFRKIETKGLNLNVQKGNLPALIVKIFESFNYQANSNEIFYSVKFKSDKSDWNNLDFFYTDIDAKKTEQIIKNKFEYWFDKDVLEKILTNLLSNAFKYTKEKGQITLTVDLKFEDVTDIYPSFVKIEVFDNGRGIPEKDLPHIFERFYQVKSGNAGFQQGSGIGLALVKELVNLHKGTIKATSKENEFSCFELQIPVHRNDYNKNELGTHQKNIQDTINDFKLPDTNSFAGTNENLHTSKSSHLIFVVDDNKDILDFIESSLKDTYRITTFHTAQKALKEIYKHLPDLILSDVMMPGMDGFEFCRIIKNNELTSHIPVILLTALASDDNQIEGLSEGADDFITKPFNSQILRLRIKQQIDLREKWQKKFMNSFFDNENIQFDNNCDKAFMDKAINIVMENISNPGFSQDDLAMGMSTSKASLYRKIKAISGQTVNEFVRTIRIKQATKLLKGTSLSVNEIAYKVGFNNPGYFMRSFKKYFNQTPSEYANSKK